MSLARRTSETPWRPLTLTLTTRRSPSASAGIFQLQVATCPAMSPLPLSGLPESRARQPTSSSETDTGTLPKRMRALYGSPACGLASLKVVVRALRELFVTDDASPFAGVAMAEPINVAAGSAGGAALGDGVTGGGAAGDGATGAGGGTSSGGAGAAGGVAGGAGGVAGGAGGVAGGGGGAGGAGGGAGGAGGGAGGVVPPVVTRLPNSCTQ